MGIFKEECYGLQCDNCNEVYANRYTDFSIFVDIPSLIGDIQGYDSGWQKINGKWYCPDCVEKLFIQDELTGEYKSKV